MSIENTKKAPETIQLQWSESLVDTKMRRDIKPHAAKCIWLTGLSGAGKSTLANKLEWELNRTGKHTYLLDGDNIRHGLCQDLGMSATDRQENIRRVGEVAHLMVDAGLIVIAAFISPSQNDRDELKRRFGAGDFIEVHVSTPLKVCEARDPKGLYKKARRVKLKTSPVSRHLMRFLRTQTLVSIPARYPCRNPSARFYDAAIWLLKLKQNND